MKRIYKLCLGLMMVIGLSNYSMAQTPLGPSKAVLSDLKKDLGSSTSKVSGIALKVSDAKSFAGKINFKTSDATTEFLNGEIQDTPGSSFYLKVSETSVEGHIILKATKEAYKYYSDKSGNAYVKKVDIHSLVCIDYENVPQKEKSSVNAQAAQIGQAVLSLQSLPGAPGCVMLDFDGYYMPAGNLWNNGNEINAAASGMSDADIQEFWEVVSEDYRPFNLNVTTDEAVFNSYPRNRRRRAVITPTNTAAPGAGGVAYIGSFNWDNDVPCWIFVLGGKSGGDAASHEVGHTFGLSHDGRELPTTGHEEYFVGLTNDNNSKWAPIMGAGYYKPVVQWSKGEYQYANNQEDDVAKIADPQWGVGYRGDDYGNGTSNAASLTYNASGAIDQKNGIIGSEADWDFFSFTTGGGNVSINANTVSRDGDLDIIIRLYNSAGAEIGNYTDGTPGNLNASMNVNLAAGNYYISIDGTGQGDPSTGGYSAYGSIGSYYITGTIPPGTTVPPSTGLVTTYKDVNYTGFSGGFSVGDYNLAALKALGVEDNSITSVKVTEGYKIILYFDDNFTGQSLEITSDNGFVGNFNDQVTSLQVKANGVTNLAGTYFLQNRNSGLNMDVWGASTADGANIAQGAPNGGTNQQYTFTHLGDGVYQILAVHSGKSVDVSAISKDDGANVQQWTYFGSANQQFIAVATDLAGCYKLIAKHSGKVVEVAGASTDNGGNIQQWTNNNQTCGQWKLIPPVTSTTGLVTTYKDVNYTGFSGGFSIGDYNLAALKALGVEDNSITSVKVTEGYKIILYFDDNFSGQSLVITSDNGFVGNFNDQVTSLQVRANGVTNVAGTYFLQNRNSGLNMDVWGASTADGANIAQGTSNGGANQQYTFTHLGDGVYQILAVHSGKSIDVDAIKTNDGANVQQWTYLGSANQQFIAVATDLAGCYKLIAKHSGKVVEVSGASTANGANVQQWTNNNQTCGQWKFVQVVVPPLIGTGDGLIGSYFNGMNFETAKLNRKDATVNFDWGNGSPDPAVNADAFSVRWTGQIQPKYSGLYTFYANTDNGRRLWINGQLIIDKWLDDWGTEYTGTISLTAGQKYDFKMEYFENYGGANAKLEWSSALQAREIIPTLQLYSPAVANPNPDVHTTPNVPPSVSLTSPANNSAFNAPASISISANASDSDGSVVKVEFFNGNQKIGEDVTSPYTFTWSNVGAGKYGIVAIATDDAGATTTSVGVTVVVTIVVVDNCGGVAQYTENNGYVAGSQVKNVGERYECKEWPYSGWCNGAAWAYAPGTGAYWTDAWYDRGACTATASGGASSPAATEAFSIAPNPVQGDLHIGTINNLSGASMTIIDVNGKVVYQSNATETINTSDLDAGIYTLIIMTTDNQKVTKRFVKIK